MYLHITYYLHIINIISRSQLGLKGSGKKPFMSILFIVPQQCSYNANHASVNWWWNWTARKKGIPVGVLGCRCYTGFSYFIKGLLYYAVSYFHLPQGWTYIRMDFSYRHLQEPHSYPRLTLMFSMTRLFTLRRQLWKREIFLSHQLVRLVGCYVILPCSRAYSGKSDCLILPKT